MPEEKKLQKIGALDAAKAAAAYFKQLYPDVSSYSLEEVELSDDASSWSITLSFGIEAPSNAMAFFQPPRTKFKVFKVDAVTGEVISMRIRKME